MDEEYDVVTVGEDPLQIPNTEESVDEDGNAVSTGYQPDTIVSVQSDEVPPADGIVLEGSEGA
jgi:high-affinity K+ transport system ATPase subunit B